MHGDGTRRRRSGGRVALGGGRVAIGGRKGGTLGGGRVALAALAALLLLAACASGPGTGGPGGPARPAADPAALVGLWRVRDAQGEGDRTWLRLDVGTYQLWRDCDGFLDGAWEASGTAFVGSQPYGVVGGCAGDEWPTVPWLRAAREYRATDDGWELLDADDDVVARLVADGAPDPINSALPSFAEPPELTDEGRAALAEPAPLPAGLAAVSADDVVGRWVPEGGAANDAHVELLADGSWTGTDGCNGAEGAWAVDAGGRLLATAGASTAIGCEGAPVPSWLAQASRAGLDGATVVLVDADGTEIARLTR